MEGNIIAIRDHKIFYFNFDWPKDGDENMTHKIELLIKSNKYFTGNKIKNEIEKLLSKYKHGKNMYGHRKQGKK